MAAALAAAMLLASRLFLATRAFPRVPVLDGWPLLQPPFDAVAAAAATVLALVLALEDQSRWQPWFYQYVAMLGALAVARDPADTQGAWRVVLVGLYLWSGIQKLNVTFMTRVFPWLVEPVTAVLPTGAQQFLATCWIVVPAMEIAVALGLLVPRLRNAAVIAAIGTHVVVFVLLGPLAHATNAVIWPWNVAMAALVTLLFLNASGASARDMVVPRRIGAHAAMLALFVALPVLSFVGRWDSYVSGELYSGNLKVGALSLTNRLAARLPEAARRHVVSERVGANMLGLYEWSMGELSVPSYAENRVFRAVARDVCRLADAPSDVVLVVFGRPALFTAQREISRNDCAALR